MTSPAPSTTPEPIPSPTTTAAPTATFSAEQEAEVNRRIAAARRDAEKDAKARLDREAADTKEAERIERERKEAEARGEFDKVRGDIERERDAARDEAKALTDRIAEYERIVGPFVDERFKAVEALGNKDLIAAYPKDADPLARLAWLDDPRLKPLLAAQDQHANNLRRFPATPRPNADGTPSVEDEKRALARTGSYSM